MKNIKKFIFIFSTIILFLGCSSTGPNGIRTFDIDNTSYVAKNKDSRIKFIVLHYTAANDESSLKTLSQDSVSVHYVVTTKDRDPIYSLVPNNERAWHAGKSSFDGRSNINDSSIGIEIVNLGYNTTKPFKAKQNGKLAFRPREYYYGYTDVQIEKIVFLINYLKHTYRISDKNIIGHSDVAPLRKQDPGPRFPWRVLYYKYGIGQWYDENDKHFFQSKWEAFHTMSPKEIKCELKKYGYDINDTDEWDDDSRKVIYAFQARFRPEKANGNMDLETYAIIKALNKKYSN